MPIERGKFPLTTASFEKIREQGMYYVDKTGMVFELLQDYQIVFLSRPRRFGKSLLLDTIGCYLEGHREMFEGLKLASKVTDWVKHPVLRLDFSKRTSSVEGIDSVVSRSVRKLARRLGIALGEGVALDLFEDLLEEIEEQGLPRLVVLIDEYDSPLLDMLGRGDMEGLQQVKEYMHEFYRTLKASERYIRFMMVTGVSQFRQVGLFSGFNNIVDLSFNPSYNSICGFSEAEIREYLSPHVERIAEINGQDFEAQMAALKYKYDGYRFSEKEEDVYNPYGLMNALVEGVLAPYWTMVGTMSSVALLIPRYDALGLINLDAPFRADREQLSRFDYERSNPVPFLYQTGYLTIKGVVDEGEYLLDFPNSEVRESIMMILAPKTLGLEDQTSYQGLQQNLVRALNGADIKTLEACIQAFLSSLPYETECDVEKAWAMRECRYRDALHLVFAGVRSDVRVGQIGAGGLSDVEIRGAQMVVVMELKIKRHGMTAERALDQAVENEYTAKHVGGEKPVWAVGAVIGEKARIEWAERCMWEGEA